MVCESTFILDLRKERNNLDGPSEEKGLEEQIGEIHISKTQTESVTKSGKKKAV